MYPIYKLYATGISSKNIDTKMENLTDLPVKTSELSRVGHHLTWSLESNFVSNLSCLYLTSVVRFNG